MVTVIACAAAACAAVNAAGVPSPATSPTLGPLGESPAASASDQDARDYCVDQGGQLVERIATSNTNGDPSAQLPLAGHMTFCEFEDGSGDSATRISVDLTTLYSTSPTLAAIAYL